MANMSKAIREEMQKHSPTISELPDDVLRELAAIVMAFGHDLSDELRRRERQ